MNTAYLRIEGVNLRHVLEDTDQLSVVRGGSLLLREAVKTLSDDFSALREISVGASVGVFAVNGAAADARELRDSIADRLSHDSRLHHFTFVVDYHIARAGEDFRSILEALLAKNRARQMAQPSLAFPDRNHAPFVEPCAWDGIRPADGGKPIQRDDKTHSVSSSIRLRYDEGRKERNMFYEKEIEESLKWQFTQELKGLATDSAFGNLSGKIAVFYADGNRFGQIQRTRCTTEEKQRQFDSRVQGYRRQFLKDLISSITQESTWFNGKEIRLETLLWGGDELLFVVPAWKGWWLLHHFFEQSKAWEFEGEPLTHAAGLVFCSYKTPISRVQHLAKELAESVKEAQSQPANGYQYLVLESVDFPTEPVAEFWKKSFRGWAEEMPAPLAPVPPTLLSAALAGLLDAAPKRQVHELVGAALNPEPGLAPDDAYKGQLKRAEAVGRQPFLDLANALESLFPGVGGPRAWFHLVSLWDYLAPQPAPAA